MVEFWEVILSLNKSNKLKINGPKGRVFEYQVGLIRSSIMVTRKLFVRVGVFRARGNETQSEWGIADKLILAEMERSPP